MTGITESAQELLEELWVAAEEEERPGTVRRDEASVEVEELTQAGLVEESDGWLQLTSKGMPQAAKAVRRHRLAERLLADVMATEDVQLDARACLLEHSLFQGLDDAICTLLGHPRFCPHGKAIPLGACCEQAQTTVDRVIAPLSALQSGQGGQIAYVQMNLPGHLQKLMSMGVLPGLPVRLLRRSPSFVFEMGLSQFAVDEAIASSVYVRLQHEAGLREGNALQDGQHRTAR